MTPPGPLNSLSTRLFPGFFAGKMLVQESQAETWQNIRAATNPDGSPLSEADRALLQLDDFEQRMRQFIRGAVLWATIGLPMLVGGLILVIVFARLVMSSPY